MSERVRLGVVGLGVMGTRVLGIALDHPAYDVVLAADPDLAARDRVAFEHRGLRLAATAEEVLDADLDAVYVATPPATHAGIVLPALERRIAVLCEKPLAVDLAEGEAMAAAAATSGVATAVNFALSDRATVRELERALAAGEAGEVRSVQIRLAFPRWPRDFQGDARWLARREQGGFLREVFSHFAYLTDRLVGELTPVEQQVRFGHGPDAAEVEASAVFAAGGVPVRVWAESQSAVPETYRWELHGTHRSWALTDWTELSWSDGDVWHRQEVPGEQGSDRHRLSAFAAAVRGEPTAHLADFAAALRVQKVVEGWLHTRLA
ncbi:Gfo/Idh/MocA family protein [Nocardioides sp.]|uniref:Gfo/Idh/MocA family protein n=1 Tax=Nocardioides sp. TaxID=35761 RepID=UPI002736B7D6|nr:Gfo/Idh/MocA family oxidoreductase [Nocardioides sp.]MDP3890789.1 Gfo/Idh/MocA family oxidoreductase [Nocardioides sp.]